MLGGVGEDVEPRVDTPADRAISTRLTCTISAGSPEATIDEG
jgi:hypothetical protein